jgi:hypothetical protein
MKDTTLELVYTATEPSILRDSPAQVQEWWEYSNGYEDKTGGSPPTLLPYPFGVYAFDSVRNKIVYVSGGFYGITGMWELDVSANTWADITPGSQPTWAGDSLASPGHGSLSSLEPALSYDPVNEQMVLNRVGGWGSSERTFLIDTWDGASWTSQTPDLSAVGSIENIRAPVLHWDSSREVLGTHHAFTLFTLGGTLVGQLDPSTWALTATGISYKAGPPSVPGTGSGTSLYGFASCMVPWNDNGDAFFITRGLVHKNAQKGGFGPPPITVADLFFPGSWVVAEVTPGNYDWIELTEAGDSLPLRGYQECVCDRDNNTVYLVGGIQGDPFNPGLNYSDTWKGVIDADAETITWEDLGDPPTSETGWGARLISVAT